MKHTIWTIINTIIFMMNLILTGITAILLVIMRDDMGREARRRIDHRNKINSIYRKYEEEE